MSRPRQEWQPPRARRQVRHHQPPADGPDTFSVLTCLVVTMIVLILTMAFLVAVWATR